MAVPYQQKVPKPRKGSETIPLKRAGKIAERCAEAMPTEKKPGKAAPGGTEQPQGKSSRPRKGEAVAVPEPLKAPGPRERAAIEHASARVKARKKRLALTGDRDGNTLKLGPAHSDTNGFYQRLLDAFGTDSGGFAESEALRLSKGLGSGPGKPADIATLNAALAVVDGISPENEVEAMLASQMAMTHALTMQAMMRAHWTEYQPEYQLAGNLAVKLSRTFTMQMEALAKLRRGGEQTVRVEHVHVHNGGQAIVGAVNHPRRGGVSIGNQSQPHAPIDSQALALAPGSSMWSEDTERDAVSVPSGER